jgi:hypothetical protein
VAPKCKPKFAALRLDVSTDNFKCRDGNNDLLWFINRVNLEKAASPSSAVRTAARRSRFASPASPSHHVDDADEESEEGKERCEPTPLICGRYRKRITHIRLAELSLFEDLFYIVWHKIQVLYNDLQVRYANKFIKLDDVIHNRGVTLQEDMDLTVQDFVILLQAYWEELTDPGVLGAFERCLRKQNCMETLHPAYDPRHHTLLDEYLLRIASLTRVNMPAPSRRGLKDVSTASPVEILNFVYAKNRIILDSEKRIEADHQAVRNAKRAKRKMNAITEKLNSNNTALTAILDPTDPKNFPCRCPKNCVCRDICIADPDGGCYCEMMPEFYDAYELDMLADEELQEEHDMPIGEHYLGGAASNESAQLIIAGKAFADTPATRRALERITKEVEVYVRKLEWAFVKDKMHRELDLLPAGMERSNKRSVKKRTKRIAGGEEGLVETPTDERGRKAMVDTEGLLTPMASGKGPLRLNKPLPPTPTPLAKNSRSEETEYPPTPTPLEKIKRKGGEVGCLTIRRAHKKSKMT